MSLADPHTLTSTGATPDREALAENLSDVGFPESANVWRVRNVFAVMAYVLVVDDSPDVRRATAALLKMLGHKANCVPSGQDALEYLQTTVPDLIILDVMMPGMDGHEVLRELRARPQMQAVPVAMYSALSDPNLQDELLSLGANDYWVKASVDPDMLERRIDELLPGSPPRSLTY